MDPNEKAHLKYKCLLCDIHTAVKKDMIRHLSTTKHKNNVNDDDKIQEVFQKIYKCKCGNEYKRTYKEPELSLEENNPLINVVEELLKNNEFKTKLIELISKTLENVWSPL